MATLTPTPAKIPREDTAAIHAFDGEPRVGVSVANGGSPVPRRPRRKFRKSVTLDPDKVAQLGLRPGKNVIAFSFSSRVWGRQEVQAHAYLWDWNAKIVVSDVDGTITKRVRVQRMVRKPVRKLLNAAATTAATTAAAAVAW